MKYKSLGMHGVIYFENMRFRQTSIFHLWLKIYMTLGGLKLILLWDPKVAHCCQLQKQKPSWL